MYVLQGYTGALPMWRNRTPFRQPFPEIADQQIAAGEIPPCIVVYVDAWTALGGSQFVDSPGTGRYHSYLCDEVVPFVDERYRTLGRGTAPRRRPASRAAGSARSSRRCCGPTCSAGWPSHAGDSLYEYCYIPEFAAIVRTLRDKYDGSYERFWEDFRSRPAMSKEDDGTLVMSYGCAACFSAEDDGTVTLPFDLDTGELIPDVWDRWLAWDPVRMVPHARRRADAACGRSTSTLARATSGTSTSVPRRWSGHWNGSASRTSTSSCSTPRTRRSITATRPA